MRSPLPILLVAADLACLLACSPSRPQDDAPAAPTPPATPASKVVAADSVTVRYWVTGCSVPDDLWRYRRESTTVTCDPRGRRLEGPQGALVWPDYLEADDVDTLTVEGEGLEGLRFELWWSRDGSFSPERSIAPAGEPADPRAVRFDMASAPQWSGSIRRFRLTWSGATSRSSRVLRAWGAKRVSPAATDPS